MSATIHVITNYDTQVTIPVSAAEPSAGTALGEYTLVGFFLPSTFDGASVTLKAAESIGGTYVAVKDGAGNTLTFTGAASQYIAISNLAYLMGLKYIKLVASTNQTSTDTVITLALRIL